MGVQVFQLRGDVERVLGMSARGIALAAEGHLPMFGGFAHVMQGWARMMSGDSARGAGLIREGFTLWDAAGGGAFRLYLRSLAAEVHRRTGNRVEAADILRDASREIESGDCDRLFEPEIYRLWGEILLDAGDTLQAEPLLRKAAETAEAGGARSLELRAALSLARLHGLRGEAALGRRRVEAAAEALHEGQGTADLREAARLLRESEVHHE